MAIRILIYCDHSEFDQTYTTSRLQAALVAADFTVGCMNRRRRGDATIDEDLLARYDEIWFLLRATETDVPDTDDDVRLTSAEQAALLAWMDAGGGVLVAGDHAEGYGPYKGLGAAVGSRIPRAKDLRVWDDVPTTDKERVATTGSDATPSPNVLPEEDATPQRLLLRRFGSDKVHWIFAGGDKLVLDRLPDHLHEGEVCIPEPWPAPGWPERQPVPISVARLIDWDAGETHHSMVVWNPDRPLGRIVADTSWHHYVDPNLKGIDTEGNPHWPKIKQLYVRLALWLARRTAVKELLLKELLSISDQLDRHIPIEQLGAAARPLLDGRPAGPWLDELDLGLYAAHGVHAATVESLPDFADYLLGAQIREFQAVPDGSYTAAEALTANALWPGTSNTLARALARYQQTLTKKQAGWKSLCDALRPIPSPG